MTMSAIPRIDSIVPASSLVSCTVEVPTELCPDLVDHAAGDDRLLWRSPSLAMLGIGSARRVELPARWATAANVRAVTRQLSSVGHALGESVLARPPVTGPVAIGSLPYDPDTPGHLVVPQVLIVKAEGRCWLTVTGNAEFVRFTTARLRTSPQKELASVLSVGGLLSGPASAPDSFQLSTTVPHEKWLSLVRGALAEIDNGRFKKVVLARRVDVRTNRPLVVPEVLSRLTALYPSCTVFHVEGFLGASPETLVSRRGLEISSYPLAGTVARSGDLLTDDALVDALLASTKDRWEHQVVVDAIASVLRDVCEKIVVPERPSVFALRNVSHLGTPISGLLRNGSEGALRAAPSALDLAARLQPTPAVGGQPTQAAMEWQRANEGFDRGRYAGPVGWLDSGGDGEWVLGLRSATVEGDRACLYAGAGIVAGSDPAAELAETQLKLQALLAALVRP
jgi:menaquinone-specific isochorismate synthase